MVAAVVAVGSELLEELVVIDFDFGFDFVAAGFDPVGVDVSLPVEGKRTITDPLLI